MEHSSSMIEEYLKNKSMLITGSTGYLGKLFVEKVLRCQPDVKQLFLLVRAKDDESARKRLEHEVIQMEIFQGLKEKYGESFHSFFWKKVTPIAGDIIYKNLGISKDNLIYYLWKDVDIIINIAANTKFNERYDTALSINTLGVEHTLEFSKRCLKLEMFLHVSTAYVSKELNATIFEEEIHIGDESKHFSRLNIMEEIQLVKKSLQELERRKATTENIHVTMKELGTKRAKMFGWPNTYTFTKAMGEIIISKQQGNIPIVILRPTIITSTYKDPFPGWIEGVRTVDIVAIGYGTGKITFFPGKSTTIFDMVPGDMVINSMCFTIAMHSCQHSLFIYHIGSSVRNPKTVKSFTHDIFEYFSKNPYTSSDGSHIKVRRFLLCPTSLCFDVYMALQYKLLIVVLWLLGMLLFSPRLKDRYFLLKNKYKKLMVVAKALQSFSLNQRRFDDRKLQNLRDLMEEKDKESFNFDTKCIDWNKYFMEVHIPGVLKYGMTRKHM